MAASDNHWRDRVKRVWIFGAGIPVFDFDAVLREGHTSKLEITDNPVETGVVVSDHAYMSPFELEIEAVVSDIWLGMRIPDRDKVTALQRDVDWLTPAEDDDTAGTRSVRAWQALRGQQAIAQPFSVQTGLELYSNLVIRDLSAYQDAKTAGALLFRATLREIIVVNTETVTYTPRESGAVNRGASKKVESGEKQGAQPETRAKKASLLLQSGRSAGVLH